MKVHDFHERLSFSEGIDVSHDVLARVAEMVPNAVSIDRAQVNDDRNGTDFWITRTHGLPPISIDAKNRSFCPIEKYGSDDACIETTSVYRGPKKRPWEDKHRHKVGWTIDYSKRTDYILYTWAQKEGVRFWIVPFVPLCAASRFYWRKWALQYTERPAYNDGYLTLSIYPPRREIIARTRELMVGTTER